MGCPESVIHKHTLRPQGADRFRNLQPYQSRRLAHRDSQEIRESPYHWIQSERGIFPAIRPAEVGNEDYLCPFSTEILYCGQCRANASIVKNSAVPQWHIEINPNQNTLAGHVNISDRLLLHVALTPSRALMRPTGACLPDRPDDWRIPIRCHTKRLSCCLLYTSPSPRDGLLSLMPSSALKK